MSIYYLLLFSLSLVIANQLECDQKNYIVYKYSSKITQGGNNHQEIGLKSTVKVICQGVKKNLTINQEFLVNVLTLQDVSLIVEKNDVSKNYDFSKPVTFHQTRQGEIINFIHSTEEDSFVTSIKKTLIFHFYLRLDQKTSVEKSQSGTIEFYYDKRALKNGAEQVLKKAKRVLQQADPSAKRNAFKISWLGVFNIYKGFVKQIDIQEVLEQGKSSKEDHLQYMKERRHVKHQGIPELEEKKELLKNKMEAEVKFVKKEPATDSTKSLEYDGNSEDQKVTTLELDPKLILDQHEIDKEKIERSTDLNKLLEELKQNDDPKLLSKAHDYVQVTGEKSLEKLKQEFSQLSLDNPKDLEYGLSLQSLMTNIETEKGQEELIRTMSHPNTLQSGIFNTLDFPSPSDKLIEHLTTLSNQKEIDGLDEEDVKNVNNYAYFALTHLGSRLPEEKSQNIVLMVSKNLEKARDSIEYEKEIHALANLKEAVPLLAIQRISQEPEFPLHLRLAAVRGLSQRVSEKEHQDVTRLLHHLMEDHHHDHIRNEAVISLTKRELEIQDGASVQMMERYLLESGTPDQMRHSIKNYLNHVDSHLSQNILDNNEANTLFMKVGFAMKLPKQLDPNALYDINISIPIKHFKVGHQKVKRGQITSTIRNEQNPRERYEMVQKLLKVIKDPTILHEVEAENSALRFDFRSTEGAIFAHPLGSDASRFGLVVPGDLSRILDGISNVGERKSVFEKVYNIKFRQIVYYSRFPQFLQEEIEAYKRKITRDLKLYENSQQRESLKGEFASKQLSGNRRCIQTSKKSQLCLYDSDMVNYVQRLSDEHDLQSFTFVKEGVSENEVGAEMFNLYSGFVAYAGTRVSCKKNKLDVVIFSRAQFRANVMGRSIPLITSELEVSKSRFSNSINDRIYFNLFGKTLINKPFIPDKVKKMLLSCTRQSRPLVKPVKKTARANKSISVVGVPFTFKVRAGITFRIDLVNIVCPSRLTLTASIEPSVHLIVSGSAAVGIPKLNTGMKITGETKYTIKPGVGTSNCNLCAVLDHEIDLPTISIHRTSSFGVLDVDEPVWEMKPKKMKGNLWRHCLFPNRKYDPESVIRAKTKPPTPNDIPDDTPDLPIPGNREIKDLKICQGCSPEQCEELNSYENEVYYKSVELAKLQGRPPPPRPDKQVFPTIELKPMKPKKKVSNEYGKIGGKKTKRSKKPKQRPSKKPTKQNKKGKSKKQTKKVEKSRKKPNKTKRNSLTKSKPQKTKKVEKPSAKKPKSSKKSSKKPNRTKSTKKGKSEQNSPKKDSKEIIENKPMIEKEAGNQFDQNNENHENEGDEQEKVEKDDKDHQEEHQEENQEENQEEPQENDHYHNREENHKGNYDNDENQEDDQISKKNIFTEKENYKVPHFHENFFNSKPSTDSNKRVYKSVTYSSPLKPQRIYQPMNSQPYNYYQNGVGYSKPYYPPRQYSQPYSPRIFNPFQYSRPYYPPRQYYPVSNPRNFIINSEQRFNQMIRNQEQKYNQHLNQNNRLVHQSEKRFENQFMTRNQKME